MTEWIDFKKNPPEEDTLAVVMNNKGWMNEVRAIYHNYQDVWVLYDPQFRENLTLEVTHYVPLPKSFPDGQL